MTPVDALLSNERASYQRDPRGSLDAYLIDSAFDTDVRNMLCYMHEADFDLRAFLDECESDRHIDLQRVHLCITLMNREQLTQLLIDYSLCPMHFTDWAICFDDDDPECAAIRAIYPHSHDT